MTRIVVIGAAGRMGRALLTCAPAFPGLTVAAALVRSGSPLLGQPAAPETHPGLVYTCDLANVLPARQRTGSPDLVAIDFSSPENALLTLRDCGGAGVPLVLGTTGLPETIEGALTHAATKIPLLVASNTSLGITLLAELVRQAAKALPASFDIEILEAHHRAKKDAPSGTALTLARAAAEGRGVPAPTGKDAQGREPSRAGPRASGEIGFAVVRGGDIVGEHTVLFAGAGERLELTHRALDRTLFAKGALQAALWLARQPPGRYAMRDLLEINQ